MFKNFIYISIISVILFFIGDLSLKIYTTKINDKNNIVTPIKSYHHTLKKNFIISKSYNNKEFKIFTNSLGFKDFKVRNIKKKINNKRFIFIGDSMTEGVGIEFENTYVGLIGKKLKEKNIEILNAGVQSYSPIIYWKKTKDLIEVEKIDFDHLVVFLDPSDVDDEQSFYQLDENKNVILRETRDKYGNLKSIEGFERFKLLIRRHTLITYSILSLLKQQSQKLKTSYHPWERAVDENDFRLSWTLKKEKEYSIGLNLMKKYMKDLHELCIKNNIKLTIVVYPLPFHVLKNDFESIHVSVWEKFSKENNIQFINNFPLFVIENAVQKDRLALLRKFYFTHDVHFNREGHKAISEIFLKKFEFK